MPEHTKAAFAEVLQQIAVVAADLDDPAAGAEAEALDRHRAIAPRVFEPGLRIGREIGIFPEDALGRDIGFHLRQEAGAAHPHGEGIERLHGVEFVGPEKAFAQGRHAEIDEIVERVAAEPAGVGRSDTGRHEVAPQEKSRSASRARKHWRPSIVPVAPGAAAMFARAFAKRDETMTNETLPHLAAELAAGRTTSRALVEDALARIADPAGEGARTFISVDAARARIAADAQDRLRQAGYVASPLAGLPVSIKDLFDVAGERTLAGSTACDDAAPATRDAAIVARLKAAGAVLVGRTNMSEFAYSGVGINPHYGTPGNPFDRKRIPGGSSSGAAVSVADGCAAVAIGTDTGGSVRIPAALCGLVGFKPTQARVPLAGALPLSHTLDSIGPLGHSVACCALADAVLAGEPAEVPPAVPTAGLRFGIPQRIMLDGLDDGVAAAFARASATLSRAGARVVDVPLTEFDDYGPINATGGFSAAEAFAWHRDLMARRGGDYDPRVRVRIERGRTMSAADYVTLVAARADFIARVDARTADFDALIMPTVAVVAPPIAAFADDRDFVRLNVLILRNPAVINFLDRCAITLPISRPGEAPVGLMVVARHGEDRRLLAMALGLEAAFAAERRA